MQRLGTNLAGRCKSVVSSGFPWVEQYQVQTRVSQPLKALGYLAGQCYLAAAIGMLSSQNQIYSRPLVNTHDPSGWRPRDDLPHTRPPEDTGRSGEFKTLPPKNLRFSLKTGHLSPTKYDHAIYPQPKQQTSWL